MTMRQWRLIIDGEPVDFEEDAPAPAPAGGQRRWRMSARAWRLAGWVAIGLGVVFEVALSMLALDQFGFGVATMVCGALACVVLVIGSRMMQ